MNKLWKAILVALGLMVGAEAKAGAVTAWDFSFVGLDGMPMPLSQYRGKAVLVVNTASQCAFTPQYSGLEALSKKYRERGLVVIGVPSNDFGGQEPGSSEQIRQFCQSNFGIDFPLTEKTRVIGDDAHPFYRWANQQLGVLSRPMWNFHKFLIGPDGRLVNWFATVTTPESPRLTRAIEAVLPN